MKRASFLIAIALLCAPVFADVVKTPAAATNANPLVAQGTVMVTTTDVNGNTTVQSFTVFSVPTAAALQAALLPKQGPPVLSPQVLANQLLYRAAMTAYCKTNLAGCESTSLLGK